MSLMSYRAPSVSVMVSPSNLEALVFFRGPICSIPHIRFSCAGVVLGSAPSTVLSIPYLVVKSGPLSTCVMVASMANVTATFSAALVWFAVAFTTSREAVTSLANYSLRFCCASSLVESFYFCIVVSLCTTISKARHSGGHESSIAKTASSIAMKGILVQFYTRSFHAMIYTL